MKVSICNSVTYNTFCNSHRVIIVIQYYTVIANVIGPIKIYFAQKSHTVRGFDLIH